MARRIGGEAKARSNSSDHPYLARRARRLPALCSQLCVYSGGGTRGGACPEVLIFEEQCQHVLAYPGQIAVYKLPERVKGSVHLSTRDLSSLYANPVQQGFPGSKQSVLGYVHAFFRRRVDEARPSRADCNLIIALRNLLCRHQRQQDVMMVSLDLDA